MVEIYNENTLWFSTNNPSVLMDVSGVIADFAKALNEEGKKQMVAHNN